MLPIIYDKSVENKGANYRVKSKREPRKHNRFPNIAVIANSLCGYIQVHRPVGNYQ